MKGDTLRTYTRGEFSVRLFTVLDESPDFSTLGTFSMKPDAVHIDHWARGGERRNTCHYFNLGTGDAEYIEQDYQRVLAYDRGDWAYIGVCAEVRWRGKVIGSASVWGVETDAGDYIIETARQEAGEAIAEAREELDAMRKVLCRR